MHGRSQADGEGGSELRYLKKGEQRGKSYRGELRPMGRGQKVQRTHIGMGDSAGARSGRWGKGEASSGI